MAALHTLIYQLTVQPSLLIFLLLLLLQGFLLQLGSWPRMKNIKMLTALELEVGLPLNGHKKFAATAIGGGVHIITFLVPCFFFVKILWNIQPCFTEFS